jgi:hypothetical protein
MNKTFLITLLFSLLMAGCNMPSGKTALPETGGLSAWLDQPIDGSRYPVGPVEVVANAYDPAGVRNVEFSVDGGVVASLDTQDAGRLSTARTTWSPSAPGMYTLRVRALNSAGAWSSYFNAVVYVGEITPTLTRTASPTATASVTPAAPPTETATPTALLSLTPTATTPVEGITFNPAPLPGSVYYGSCQPNMVNFKVSLGNFSQVSGVVVFYRAANANTGEHPEWSSESMNPLGSGTYTRTVAVDAIPESRKYDPARLEYQFVAVDTAGQVAARSPFYANVSITPCGQAKPTIKPSANPNATPTQ